MGHTPAFETARALRAMSVELRTQSISLRRRARETVGVAYRLRILGGSCCAPGCWRVAETEVIAVYDDASEALGTVRLAFCGEHSNACDPRDVVLR